MDNLMVEDESRHNPGNSEPWPFKSKLYPLHLAVCSKNLNVVQMLLENGAIVDALDMDGWSALVSEGGGRVRTAGQAGIGGCKC